ncbi:MAG: DUF4097 family beta strand repeat-containing protein [Planctomycetota bacterium]
MARAWALAVVATMALTGGCGSLVHATREVAFREPWAGYERIEVHARNGSVELVSGGTDGLAIDATLRVGGTTFGEAEANLDALKLHAAADPDHPRTFRVELQYPPHLQSKSPAANLRITLPEPCAAAVNTSNGSIRVENLKGDVVLDTSNGAIRARKVDGNLRADTSNGSVEVENVTGSLRAKSSNGELIARGISGPCELITSNGRIEYAAAPAAAGAVEAHTSNGDVQITLPRSTAAALDCRTRNGRVHVDAAEAALGQVETERGAFRATLNGGGVPVRVRTSNGSIDVNVR